jgi:hypothetical protein
MGIYDVRGPLVLLLQENALVLVKRLNRIEAYWGSLYAVLGIEIHEMCIVLLGILSFFHLLPI